MLRRTNSFVKICVNDADLRSSPIGLDPIVKTHADAMLTTSRVFVCADPDTGNKKIISTPR